MGWGFRGYYLVRRHKVRHPRCVYNKLDCDVAIENSCNVKETLSLFNFEAKFQASALNSPEVEKLQQTRQFALQYKPTQLNAVCFALAEHLKCSSRCSFSLRLLATLHEGRKVD